MRWIDLSNVPKDFDGLMNLIVFGKLSSTSGYISEREKTKGTE